MISPEVLRGVQPLPAINGPACGALPHSSFCVIRCITATDVMSSPATVAVPLSKHQHPLGCKAAADTAKFSSDFGECVLNRNGLRSMLCDVFALHSLVPLQSTKQYRTTASLPAAGASVERFLFIIVCLRVMSGNMRTGEI